MNYGTLIETLHVGGRRKGGGGGGRRVCRIDNTAGLIDRITLWDRTPAEGAHPLKGLFTYICMPYLLYYLSMQTCFTC